MVRGDRAAHEPDAKTARNVAEMARESAMGIADFVSREFGVA